MLKKTRVHYVKDWASLVSKASWNLTKVLSVSSFLRVCKRSSLSRSSGTCLSCWETVLASSSLDLRVTESPSGSRMRFSSKLYE